MSTGLALRGELGRKAVELYCAKDNIFDARIALQFPPRTLVLVFLLLAVGQEAKENDVLATIHDILSSNAYHRLNGDRQFLGKGFIHNFMS